MRSSKASGLGARVGDYMTTPFGLIAAILASLGLLFMTVQSALTLAQGPSGQIAPVGGVPSPPSAWPPFILSAPQPQPDIATPSQVMLMLAADLRDQAAMLAAEDGQPKPRSLPVTPR